MIARRGRVLLRAWLDTLGADTRQAYLGLLRASPASEGGGGSNIRDGAPRRPALGLSPLDPTHAR